jgi:hypothetical protein
MLLCSRSRFTLDFNSMRFGLFYDTTPLVLVVAVLATAAPAGAAGYWHVPSSFCQCVGSGWGAGYHAPLVLGPGSCRSLCTTNEVRLPYAPAPYYGCTMQNGCAGGYYQPTQLEPLPALPPNTVTPHPVDAATTPAATPHRALFRSPIER